MKINENMKASDLSAFVGGLVQNPDIITITTDKEV
jgi:hypothetical protein